MKVLVLLLAPLVAGWDVWNPHPSPRSYHPSYKTVGLPYKTVVPSFKTVGPSYKTVGPSYKTVGSPYKTLGSPYTYKTVRTPFHYRRPNFQQRLATGTGIVEQTRRQTDSLAAVLRNLAKVPGAAKYIDRVLEVSDCVDNLEDAIEAIEAGTKLVENAEPELLKLVKTVENIKTEKDIVSVVRIAADILRQLEVLIPKIAPETPSICGTSPEATFAALRSVSVILEDVSKDLSLPLTLITRNDLKRSGTVVYAVTTFLKQLRTLFSDLKEACSPDKEYNLKAIAAIGDMLDNLSDLFGVVGGFTEAKEVKIRTEFTDNILAAINQIEDLGFGTLECNAPGSFKVAAETLEEVADLVAEIGIENLKTQLGIDLDFL